MFSVGNRAPYYEPLLLTSLLGRTREPKFKGGLKIFHHQNQKGWDRDLPWLSTAFNTARHENTQVNTDTLFLGCEMQCPLNVRWDLSPIHSGRVKNTDRNFWSAVYGKLKEANRRVARPYNQGCTVNNFRVGDMVRYRLNPISSKAREISAKLMLKWSEPCVILREVRPNVVLLGRQGTRIVVRRAH